MKLFVISHLNLRHFQYKISIMARGTRDSNGTKASTHIGYARQQSRDVQQEKVREWHSRPPDCKENEKKDGIEERPNQFSNDLSMNKSSVISNKSSREIQNSADVVHTKFSETGDGMNQYLDDSMSAKVSPVLGPRCENAMTDTFDMSTLNVNLSKAVQKLDTENGSVKQKCIDDTGRIGDMKLIENGDKNTYVSVHNDLVDGHVDSSGKEFSVNSASLENVATKADTECNGGPEKDDTLDGLGDSNTNSYRNDSSSLEDRSVEDNDDGSGMDENNGHTTSKKEIQISKVKSQDVGEKFKPDAYQQTQNVHRLQDKNGLRKI
ncbi:hypothetical protein KUTeg_009632 [Tegillarca granosa]|uniref:Uncharacterized protein n=1 Tax=Tegillarca granosa TaxID=220873 RepID=A0ABQ9F4G0_TEGGR|nr:hypothetical protein KUTeg_009632 [Tegillarca granosa]